MRFRIARLQNDIGLIVFGPDDLVKKTTINDAIKLTKCPSINCKFCWLVLFDVEEYRKQAIHGEVKIVLQLFTDLIVAVWLKPYCIHLLSTIARNPQMRPHGQPRHPRPTEPVRLLSGLF